METSLEYGILIYILQKKLLQCLSGSLIITNVNVQQPY